jgi:ribose 5-phosphate isomerase B
MTIALATDHAGFENLKQLEQFLQSKGHECKNFGPAAFKADDDYPDFIRPAAEAVAKGESQMGIIVGGSGQGEAMVANRVKGVRCAVFYGPAAPVTSVDAEGNTTKDPFEIVILSRQHNNANMLSLAARFVSLDDMKKAVEVWLGTPFSDVERHARRVSKIDEAG